MILLALLLNALAFLCISSLSYPELELCMHIPGKRTMTLRNQAIRILAMVLLLLSFLVQVAEAKTVRCTIDKKGRRRCRARLAGG